MLRALTTVRLGDEAMTLRPAPLADVANTPAKSALVDALIAARLLVSDENAEGQAVIRLVHEALLTRWPRAREIVSANRNFLETRARVQADARRWVSSGKNAELLLPHGMRLAEGEELLRSRGEEVGDQVGAYITTSALAEQTRIETERQAERTRIEVRGGGEARTAEHGGSGSEAARAADPACSLRRTRAGGRGRGRCNNWFLGTARGQAAGRVGRKQRKPGTNGREASKSCGGDGAAGA